MSKKAGGGGEVPMVYVVDATSGAIIYRPANEGELAQAAKDVQAAVLRQRELKQRAVREALAASDHWVVRAFEEGGKLSPERRAHRGRLRELLAQVATSDDPAALEVPPVPQG